jgi:hypothetical protein
MASCGYCKSFILIGGVRKGADRFCNDKCHQGAYVLSLAQRVPADLVAKHVQDVFRGNCPQCNGLGPIDVHKVHRVWSALVLTSWSSSQKVCCRSCATKGQLGAALLSGTLGWWGFPWGLIMTPIMVARNVMGICAGPDSSRPSADLEKLVRVNLGVKLLAASEQKPPPIPK